MADAQQFYDHLEIRDAEARERSLFAMLEHQLAHAKANTAYYRERLADVAPGDIADRAALAAIPVTRKSDIVARQAADPPFGGLNGVPLGEIAHVYVSPGPVYEPDAATKDYWGYARAFWAAGIRPGDLVYNTYAYHLTPAAAMMESAARAIGCPMVPGGTGNTEQQVEAIRALRPAAYVGTPSFLRILLDKLTEAGGPIDIAIAAVGGEALPSRLRTAFEEAGVRTSQTYATADLGLVAYESPARAGMVVTENLILEIVRPGGDAPVAPGDVGEIVITNFNPVYPMIRYGTGDLSAILAGDSPCGRTNMRIKGWMGRADQSAKLKGMFVHAKLVDDVIRRHPEIRKARLILDSQNGADRMTLHCEVEAAAADLETAVARTLHEVLKLKGGATVVPPGTLPNDGLVIEDSRQLD